MTKQAQINHMAVSILGNYNPDLLSMLMRQITLADCQLLDSNFSKLGEQLAGFVLIAGLWHQLAKFEHGLQALAQEIPFGFQVQRTEHTPPAQSQELVYTVYAESRAQTGVTDAIVAFFTAKGMSILESVSYVHQARYTAADMLTTSILISLEQDIDVADLRDQFAMLCDELDIDGSIELER